MWVLPQTSARGTGSLAVEIEVGVGGKRNMADYWQDKRINQKHVACAWGLVLVVIALMLAITSPPATDCSPRGDLAADNCPDGMTTTGERQSTSLRGGRPGKG